MIVKHSDTEGRWRAYRVPKGTPEELWPSGVLIGPPPLDLDLPEEVLTRLHNELFHRGILTLSDAKARRGELVASIQAALKLDAGRIIQAFESSSSS